MLEKGKLTLKHAQKYASDQIKFLRQQRQLANYSNLQSDISGVRTLATSSKRFFRAAPTKRIGEIRKQSLTSKSINSQVPSNQEKKLTIDVNFFELDIKNMADNTNNETKQLTQLSNHIHQKPKFQPKYDVHRDVLTHEVIIKQTGYAARDKSIPSGLISCWKNWSFLSIFTGIVPIVQWLPKYSPKHDLMRDIIAGFTVAIMNIPHGIAYGLLAGVSAGNGLYMAVFPVIVYMIFGTSKQISIGTFAVASMMTLKVVQTFATDENIPDHIPQISGSNIEIVTPLEVATSLALTVGIVHMVMALFRLGTLASLLSEPLVNGFTTGAACHVLASQLKDVLGVTVPRYKGAFKIIFTLVDIFKSIPKTNLIAFSFCVAIMIFMSICNECLRPCIRKKCKFPLPAELIAIIGGTLLSKYLDMHTAYSIGLVGVIPKGLPTPELPRLDLVPKLVLDAIAIAIVTFSIVMSMGITFAKKHSYEVRPNQELFAMGMGNIVGGFFSCIPMACSLSRSVIQDQTGGVSQIASLVSASLVIVTLVWAGPFFSDLPRCVLAGVIIVALKPMFIQAKELKKFSKQGKLEILTWTTTFSLVVLIDIDIGLLLGIFTSLLALYVKGVKPYYCMLGYTTEAPAVYVDISQHRNAVELPDTKIFRYCGSLNFATCAHFRRALYNGLEIKKKYTSKIKSYELDKQHHSDNVTISSETACLNRYKYLILDFSMLGHIDVAGCRTLSDINKEMNSRGIFLFLASPVDRVYDTLVHSMALGEGPFDIYPTLHDAVEYVNACRTA